MIRSLLLSACMLGTSIVPATAQNYGEPVKIDVLHGWQTARGGQMAAFRLRLSPGWKTYWRVPGEAGIPPRFSWAGSRNLASVAVHWPAPKVYSSYGMRTIGYSKDLILPVEFTPKTKGRPINIKAQLEIGVCEEVCIPVNVTLRATLKGTGASVPAIQAALNARPKSGREAGVRNVTCKISPIEDGFKIEAALDVPKQGGSEFAVIEIPGQPVWVSEAKTKRKGKRVSAVAEILPTTSAPFLFDRSNVRITVIGAKAAVDVLGCTRG